MRRLSLIKFLELGLFLFVILMPLQNRDLFSLFGTRLFPPRLVLIVMIVVSFIYCLAYLFRNKGMALLAVKAHVKYLWNDLLLRTLLILWLVRLLSLRSTLNTKASLNLLLFFSSMIALYLILRYLNQKTPYLVSRVYKIHLIVVSIVGLYGFLEFLLALMGHKLPGVLTGGSFVRIPATFYDANHLPAYLLTGLPVILVSVFYVKNEVCRSLNYLLILVLSFVVFLTYSRSGIIGFSISFFSILFYLVWKRYWRKLFFPVFCLVLATTFIFLTSFTNYSLIRRLGSIFNVEDRSTAAHGVLLYGGLKVWQDSPFFGVGYGGFSEAFRSSTLGKQLAYFDPAVDVRVPVHSVWLEVLAETGLLGFAVYLSLMIIIYESASKAFVVLKRRPDRLKQIALLSGFTGLLGAGVFYSYNLEFFWFFLFLLYLRSEMILSVGDGSVGQVEFEIEESEGVKWKELLAPFCLFTFLAIIIFLKIGDIDLSSNEDGVFALTAKTIRRAYGYGWKNSFIPRLQEEDKYLTSYQPLYFYLNAFSFFLFDLNNFSVRLWSALSGLFSLTGFYFIGRRIGGSIFSGVLQALVVSILPGFLLASRGASSTASVYFFISLIILSLLNFENRFFAKIALFLSVILLPIIRQDFLLLAPALYILVWLALRNKLPKLSLLVIFSGYLIALLLTGFWFKILTGMIQGVHLSQFWSEVMRMLETDLRALVLIVLAVFMTTLLSKSRFKKLVALIILSILILNIVDINLDKSRNQDRYSLIAKRLDFNRNGRIPLYVPDAISSVDYYYSEVPIVSYSEQDVFKNFIRDREIYTIIDGRLLNKLRLENIDFSPLLEIRSVSGNMLLVHQAGFVP